MFERKEWKSELEQPHLAHAGLPRCGWWPACDLRIGLGAGAHRRRLDAYASRSSSSMAHTDRDALSASHGMGVTPTGLPTASWRVSRRGLPV